MKKRNLFVLAGLTCLFAVAFAQDGGMSEADVMKKWMEAGTPGESHAALAKHAGEWDCVVKSWMDPSQPPMESKGTDKCVMELGGRVLKGSFTGDMMGTPFNGQSMTGYSNVTNTFWSTWIDDMSTALTYCEGKASEDGKTIIMLGTMDDPISGVMDKPIKQVLKLVDDDHYTFEMWDNVGTDQEVKSVEITYTRKK